MESRKLRVLVVDDNATNLLILANNNKKLFSANGYEVTKASSAEGALDLVVKNKFDLIVCDFQMPVLEPSEDVKSAFKDKNISVIDKHTPYKAQNGTEITGANPNNSGARFLKNLRQYEVAAGREPVDFIFCTTLPDISKELQELDISTDDYQGKSDAGNNAKGKSFTPSEFANFNLRQKALFKAYALETTIQAKAEASKEEIIASKTEQTTNGFHKSGEQSVTQFGLTETFKDLSLKTQLTVTPSDDQQQVISSACGETNQR